MARGEDEFTEVELLAQIAGDVREVRNYVRLWWWLTVAGVVLVLLAQLES